MKTCPSPQATPRRGMLLLLVLSMLTIFMMLAVLMLVMATRSRLSAHAFATATASNGASTGLAKSLLDEALIKLIHGPSAPLAIDDVSESLLEDKYGTATALIGTLQSIAGSGPLLSATVAVNVTKPIELNGRIITCVPQSQDGGDVASYRILRATGAGSPYTCQLANLRSNRPTILPGQACNVIINGPEFRSEAYDGFDDNNKWLTHIVLENCRPQTVVRPAFGTGTPTVDNDDDGVADGIWLSKVLPSRVTPDGGMLDFEVSYLVLDLDSRININAHGSLTSIEAPAATWTGSADVPIGNGYGPADVDASSLFVDPLANNQQVANPPAASAQWARLVRGGTATIAATVASDQERRPAPIVGGTGGQVEGRYGAAASVNQPASPGDLGDDALGKKNDADYGLNLTIDLKSRLKTSMDSSTGATGAVPKLLYYTPDWTKAGFVDDPYEMRLDSDGPRVATLATQAHSPSDNPFTLAELERVLREFDPDASVLPSRLAAVLDNFCERSRMTITTDSWDTPALTGDVAALILTYAKGLSDPYAILSPDITAGLRFDINRQLLDAASKQDYCKHLFTLLVALGQPANAATAQWVANALDYRDPDSTLTRFQYDTDLSDGWQTNNTDVVFGAERPELIIAQTLAWRTDNDPNVGELYVSVYHPWSAMAVNSSGTQTPIDTIDPALGSNNKLDMRRKIGADPVWRLRFDGNKYIRFDVMGSSVPANTFGSSQAAQNSDTQMGPNTYLCVTPNGNSSEGIQVDNSLPTFGIDQGGVFKVSSPGNDDVNNDADSTIYLERLADPSLPLNAITNPYRTVDELGVKLINRAGGDPNNWRSFLRDPPFWKQPTFSKQTKPPKLQPLQANATNWFPWPNRPFISHAELALVPQGDASAMLASYDIPKNKNTSPAYFLPTEKLLDATLVPSRFAGSCVTVPDAASLQAVGMEKFSANQLSRWREPGRVNLNTVLDNNNCTDSQLNDAVWWSVLGQDATVGWSPFAGNQSATSIRDMLTLKQGTVMFRDTAGEASATNGNSKKKNRAYDLNPALTYSTAIRLANVATIRSNVFAVWVTLKTIDRSANAAPPTYHRTFAIVDRSIPVGYNAGETLNARDTIRLQRFLE